MAWRFEKATTNSGWEVRDTEYRSPDYGNRPVLYDGVNFRIVATVLAPELADAISDFMNGELVTSILRQHGNAEPVQKDRCCFVYTTVRGERCQVAQFAEREEAICFAEFLNSPGPDERFAAYSRHQDFLSRLDSHAS